MKGGMPAALALGAGYILGRRRRLRTTTILAIGAATGGLGGLAPAALRRGVKMLGSTDLASSLGPQLGEITDAVRGDLLDAGKAAAMAAMSNRIESLSDALHDRAESLRNPEAAVGEAGERVRGEASERVRSISRRRGRGRSAREDAGDEAGDETGDEADEPVDDIEESGRAEDEAEEDLPEDEPRADEDFEDEDAEDAGDEDAEDEDEEEPAPRRRRTRSPVARSRR